MDGIVKLAHGAGGKQTSELIEKIFKAHFDNGSFTADDAAVLPRPAGKLAMTTDGFIVSPYRFPGGDIGKLSVCGTVNDLACMGAEPEYMTCAFVIEEGFPLDELEMIAASMEETAREAGVRIVAGDTKVAGKGQADKLFITTSGIGSIREGTSVSGAFARPGDAVIVTNDIGRHGCAVLLAREELGIEARIKSDCAPLWNMVRGMLEVSDRIHVIRDATRGGVGTVLYEIARQSGAGIALQQSAVPVSPEVSGLCGLLGLDPLYLANEGTMTVIVPEEDAQAVLEALHKDKYGRNAAIIGSVTSENAGNVVVTTAIGTQTLLPRPGGELLPRIC